MSLVINHNMMAMNTARTLSNTYGRLNASVQRLSSGLRINSAADDAAGLAIRELMRADISTMQQGVRNIADAISMIQTADGGMAVIDEKLTRMKELAEQAATGTYTTLQREIINSEYQAMAAEIDRIATATNFNGVKLLDGSITNLHGGQGMKIHFGVGNSPDEDYYFINTGDVRATSSTGLRIGGDAKNDIWGQGAAGSKGLAGPGCCTAGYSSLDGNAGFVSGSTFAYGYNWDWMEDDDEDLLTGKYLAGRYQVGSSWSLQDLINAVNKGSQSRVGVQINSADLASAVTNGGTTAVCVGDEAYVFGSASVGGGKIVVAANPGGEGFTATGTYTDLNRFSNGTYSIDTAQAAALSGAGFNLSAMGFNAVSITYSASVVGNSAAAKAAVSAYITAQVMLLNNNKSALTVVANSNSGIEIQSAKATGTANAASIAPHPARTIVSGKTVTIETGYFADANGNWTSSVAMATALGLSQIIYTITNPNIADDESKGTYTANVVVTAGSAFTMDQATYADLAAAGLQLAAPPSVNGYFTSASATVSVPLGVVDAHGSAATAIQSALNAFFNKLSAITSISYSTNNGSGAASLSQADFTTALGAVISGTWPSTISTTGAGNVGTGVYMDNSGNFTNSASIAAAYGLDEITFRVSGGTAVNTVTVSLGGTTLAWPAGYTGLFSSTFVNTTTAEAILNEINAVMPGIIAAHTSNPGAPGLMLTGAKTPVAPPYPSVNQITWDDKKVYNTSDDLVVTANRGGAVLDLTTAGDRFTITTNVGFSQNISQLAVSVTVSVKEELLALQGATGGKIIVAPSTFVAPTITFAGLAGNSVTPVTIGATPEQTIPTTGIIDSTKYATLVASAGTAPRDANNRSNFGAWALASAINHNARSQFWAMYEMVTIPATATTSATSVEMCYIFTKEGGNYDSLLACDVADGDVVSQAGARAIRFENLQSGDRTEAGTSFSLGGQDWGSFKPVQTKAGQGNEVWNLTLHGRDVGKERDLWIAALADGENEVVTPGLNGPIINGLDRHSFVEIQNAANGEWDGAEVRTQSSAQEALEALNGAMERKDKVRADIGALQNRLENSMTNLQIQIEALQASESRISDVDMATEMTEFVRNQVLAQAAVSMLSQANSLPQMALSLLNG